MKITASVSLILGVVIGLGIYLAKISRFHSYLSNDPTACINCHVMNTAYDTWSHSAHREVTTCNSCHVPHDNFIKKYVFKGMDGFRHAYVFTTRTEPQVLKISDRGASTVQRNCISCHESKVLSHGNMFDHDQINDKNERKCWSCHKSTPHGKVRNLSTTYQNINPNKIKLNKLVPDWIKKELERERKNEVK
jgi:cytochrome c nitrite reductase small subunit